MGYETPTVTSTTQRPPTLHFNQNFFNNINTQNYKHIEISPEADNDTTQFVRAANNDNYFAGLTTGLLNKPDEHMVTDTKKMNPMINLNPTTCPGYARCIDKGEMPEGSFMLIA